jgi:GntR family transcriptional regulator
VASYMDIARDLRRRIDKGEWSPGDKLPSLRQLASEAEYDTRKDTVDEAFGVLVGWNYIRRKRGTPAVVVDRAAPKVRLAIGRRIGRNEYGYLYNPSAGHWAPIGVPDRSWVELRTVPDVAVLLDLDPSGWVLGRHRVVGPGGVEPAQTTTTYMAEWLGREMDVDDTGPGGWIEQVEQRLVPGPVRWNCTVTSRLPLEHEAEDLGLTLAMPVLVLAFTITGYKHRRPLAVDVMTFDASRFEVEYPVTRSAEAHWPVSPATERNRPIPHSN